jgi:hypothetical protein
MDGLERNTSMKYIEVIVRCEAYPDTHAKKLRIDIDLPAAYGIAAMEYARSLASLLDGTSEFYIYKPGPNSPIGRCCSCGAKVITGIFEVEVEVKKDAESKG